MTSKAKLLGHPIHPMLIVFPLGLLGMAVIFDLIYLGTGRTLWTGMAYYMIGAGLITGLLAAVFGLVDWLAIPAGTRAKVIGAWHGIGNVVVMALFFASWLIRTAVAGDAGDRGDRAVDRGPGAGAGDRLARRGAGRPAGSRRG
jgi:uncharacterized membrane protein